MSTSLAQRVIEAFRGQHGAEPVFVVRAPGRVNLIGEHTDYNDGFVLPMAIDRATWIALRPRTDDQVRLHSLDFQETVTFSGQDLTKGSKSWSEYPKGVAWALQQAGFDLRGWEGVTACDVPMGAGLSSSASFELATARASAAVANWNWDAPAMALLCQKAENQWVGVNCGIMDQMISAVGQQGYAVLIDCRDLARQPVPLPAGTVVIVMDTGTRRGLVDSAYNERRQQCESAARFFGFKVLRDVTAAQFEEQAGRLDEMTRRRARHVIRENERTLQAAEAMRQGDARRLGQLMNASHASLRDDFEVSNGQLNEIVSLAVAQPGCLGARMTGAGFGGCAVALVEEAAALPFIQAVAGPYQQATGLEPRLYVCHPTNGAEVV
ncbi:MAG: galactokinase [Planctomycetes bacterium]|nr:galactokinase [Planctomycetota bacterium]